MTGLLREGAFQIWFQGGVSIQEGVAGMSIFIVPLIGPLTIRLKRVGLLSCAGNITQSISAIPSRTPSMIPNGLVIGIPFLKACYPRYNDHYKDRSCNTAKATGGDSIKSVETHGKYDHVSSNKSYYKESKQDDSKVKLDQKK